MRSVDEADDFGRATVLPLLSGSDMEAGPSAAPAFGAREEWASTSPPFSPREGWTSGPSSPWTQRSPAQRAEKRVHWALSDTVSAYLAVQEEEDHKAHVWQEIKQRRKQAAEELLAARALSSDVGHLLCTEALDEPPKASARPGLHLSDDDESSDEEESEEEHAMRAAAEASVLGCTPAPAAAASARGQPWSPRPPHGRSAPPIGGGAPRLQRGRRLVLLAHEAAEAARATA